MEHVTRCALGDDTLPFTGESSFRDKAIKVKVNYIHWEYFTVGCTAPALNQVVASNVLSLTDSEEISYKQLAQQSPSVSYLHRYDGSVVGVTLRELHPLGNPAELFGRERRDKLQGDLNALMRNGSREITAERMAALARSDNWYHKIRNPASLLEFDTRNMVVEPVATARWLVRPRVALFNSSSMNSIANEIAQIGSELLARFGDTEHAKHIACNVAFLDDALHYEHGVESMLGMRDQILRGAAVPQLENPNWTKGAWWETGSTPWSPPCFEHERYAGANVSEHGYPTNFTLDEVDYCNLMYWIILPSLGARVYRRGAAARQAEHAVRSQLRYRNGERDLSENLGLSDANRTLTVARLTGDCAFSKVRPSVCEVDVSEHFEPTASRHKSCTDAGFHETSVVTYVWAIRLARIARIGNNLAKVLLGMHYSTLLTHEVIRDHYDTAYYSGMSYLLFRGVRFTGCGVSLMQQKSALYTLGTEVLCNPTSHNTHQVHTVNQYCESVVIPETLESPGLYIPNLYMKDVHVDGRGGPYDMVIADAFNGFCPESDSASGYRRPYLFTTGRSQALQGLGGAVPKDPLMSAEAYTCMPTLLRPFSSTLRGSQRGRRRDCDEESNRRLFCNALHAQEFERSVLDSIGDPFKDTVERANGNKRATDIMQPSLGVAFCGTYGVGLTSDKKLMTACDPTAQEPLVERLAPRISGTGVFACNPMRTTSRLIAPVFSRVFHALSYNRILRI
ncbi:hypothetical protein Q5P01_016598 [Channa striata]|uniref:Uncharacterized protein n=1 Tax=Channa striata TaxID=64152 RepID=A0AA88M976_CHASR|nr:hypothetical protein Q5P01_016598 [Channa striata]